MTTIRDQDLIARKHALRTEARARRKVLSRAVRETAAAAALVHFLRNVKVDAGASVAAYWPLADEFDVRPFLFALHAAAHPCALPVVVGRRKPLLFRQWQPDSVLEEAGFGVWVPPATAPALRPDVLLVPLLAFDATGYRLGYGGGFYDQTLAALRADGNDRPLAVGVAFAMQEVDRVPSGPDDQPLDWMVTEAGAWRVRANNKK